MDGSLEPGRLVMVLPPTFSWDVDRSHAFVGFRFSLAQLNREELSFTVVLRMKN